MPISLNTFNKLHAQQQDPLPERILKVLQEADETYNVQELTAKLLGVTGRYGPVLDPKVQQAVPMVQKILDGLVEQKRIRSAVAPDGPLGPKLIYGKLDDE
jgi:hypothetical protein